MRPAPPKAMEAVVGWLVPPACREEVLGDLHERFVSPRQYLADALSTVPLVVASQIRRTTDAQLRLIEACALYLPLLAAAWLIGGAALVHEESALSRLAIPAAAGLLAMILGDAYADPRKGPVYARVSVAMLAGVCACFSQVVVWALSPGWLVPRSILILGASLGVLLLSAVRMVFQPDASRIWHAMPRGPAACAAGQRGREEMSLEEIRRRSREFQKKVWRDVVGCLVALAAVLGLAAWNFTVLHTRGDGFVGAAIAVIGVFVAYQIYRKRPRGGVPPDGTLAASLEAYREQLARRREALRGIWAWYAGPVLAIMLAFVLRVAVADLDDPGLWLNVMPFSVLAAAWSIALAFLSQRQARKLQDEMDVLEAAQKR